jgi:ABC-type transporter Mla subunit MlaD
VVGLVLWLGGNRITEGHLYETYFRESVTGLDVGAAVKFRGVTVGQVRSIRLASAVYTPDVEMNLSNSASRLIVVAFVVDPHRVGKLPATKEAVTAGLRARIASAGLTGLSYIELDFVNPSDFPLPVSYNWTPRFDVIPSVPSTITQVQDAATSLLAKLNAIDLAGLQNRMFLVLDEVHTSLQTGAAKQVLGNAATLLADIDTAVKQADLPALTASLRQTSEGVNTLAQGPQTREAMQKLTQALDKLPAAVAALQGMVAHLDRTQTDLAASLAPVLRDAQATAANLRDLSDSLARYPAGAVFGGPPPQESNK